MPHSPPATRLNLPDVAVHIGHPPRPHERTFHQTHSFTVHLRVHWRHSSRYTQTHSRTGNQAGRSAHLSIVVCSLYIRHRLALRTSQSHVLIVAAKGKSLVMVVDAHPSPEANQRAATN